MSASREILTAKMELEFPYSHSTGKVIGRFLTELRDNQRILGLRCRECRRVIVPAQDYCETCGASLEEWVQVADSGSLMSWAVVRKTQPIHPLSAPFAFALIRLDGADTDMLHLLKARDYQSLRQGMRVRAVWKEQREGTILDISHFEPGERGENG